MSYLKVITAVVICLFPLSIGLHGCKESVDNPSLPTYDSLTVIKPGNGDTFTVGELVEVRWAYPPDWPYSQVRIKLYGDSGLTALGDIHEPVDNPQDTILWLVEDDHVSTNCYIVVEEYFSMDDAISEGFFTVKQP